jgi:hypothetical protein
LVMQIARSTTALFPSQFGGLSALSRVPNNPNATTEWEAAARARLGLNVSLHDDGFTASVNQVGELGV